MGRKPAFKPLIHSDQLFHKTEKMLHDHGKALDGWERDALIAPDRAFDQSKQWLPGKALPKIFSHRPGREIDVVDEDRSDYFNYSRAGSTMETFVKSRGQRTAMSTRNLTSGQ